MASLSKFSLSLRGQPLVIQPLVHPLTSITTSLKQSGRGAVCDPFEIKPEIKGTQVTELKH